MWTLDDSANNYRWRTGRKLGRTIYVQEGIDPSDDDPFIGLMETAEIAAQVVELHNDLMSHSGRRSEVGMLSREDCRGLVADLVDIEQEYGGGEDAE